MWKSMIYDHLIIYYVEKGKIKLFAIKINRNAYIYFSLN